MSNERSPDGGIDGGKVILEQITASANVPAQDIQITISDIPSENYAESIRLSDGLDQLALPTDDGTYQLTVAVVATNADYTGVSQWRFTIGALPFTDVRPDDSAYSAVKALYDKGILLGTSATAFSPDATVTRATAITALGRLLGVEQSDTALFQDIKQGSWYSGYVGWAVDNGIVQGDGAGRFWPNKSITASHMNLILTRYAALTGTPANTGSDSDQPLTRKELAILLAELL